MDRIVLLGFNYYLHFFFGNWEVSILRPPSYSVITYYKIHNLQFFSRWKLRGDLVFCFMMAAVSRLLLGYSCSLFSISREIENICGLMFPYNTNTYLIMCVPLDLFQDSEMHRGKPLYLNEERYAALNHMVKKELLCSFRWRITYPNFAFKHL